MWRGRGRWWLRGQEQRLCPQGRKGIPLGPLGAGPPCTLAPGFLLGCLPGSFPGPAVSPPRVRTALPGSGSVPLDGAGATKQVLSRKGAQRQTAEGRGGETGFRAGVWPQSTSTFAAFSLSKRGPPPGPQAPPLTPSSVHTSPGAPGSRDGSTAGPPCNCFRKWSPSWARSMWSPS